MCSTSPPGGAGRRSCSRETFGCRIEGIEIAPEFHAAAVERAESRGLSQPRLVPARATPRGDELEPEEYDVALCLGASFVYGSLADTVEALVARRETRRPRRRRRAVLAPPAASGGLRGSRRSRGRRSADTVAIFETSGLPRRLRDRLSEDDWDRYETLHWRAVEEWLAANPDDPDAAEIRTRSRAHKRTYLRHGREYLGWAIFIGWKPDGAS